MSTRNRRKIEKKIWPKIRIEHESTKMDHFCSASPHCSRSTQLCQCNHFDSSSFSVADSCIKYFRSQHTYLCSWHWPMWKPQRSAFIPFEIMIVFSFVCGVQVNPMNAIRLKVDISMSRSQNLMSHSECVSDAEATIAILHETDFHAAIPFSANKYGIRNANAPSESFWLLFFFFIIHEIVVIFADGKGQCIWTGAHGYMCHQFTVQMLNNCYGFDVDVYSFLSCELHEMAKKII